MFFVIVFMATVFMFMSIVKKGIKENQRNTMIHPKNNSDHFLEYDPFPLLEEFDIYYHNRLPILE
jgi:hypothetical protein